MTHRRVLARAFNAEGVSERDPVEEANRALTIPGEYGLPNIVTGCEVSWLDGHRLAAKLGWYALQEGERGDPEAGVAIFADRPIQSLGSLVGSRPVPGKVRMRPILGGRVYGLAWWAIHAPRKDVGGEHYAYIARARARRGVIMGDWNESDEWMRQTSQRHYRGFDNDVMGVLVPRRLRAGQAAPVDVHSDHWGLDVPIDIPLRGGR